MCRGKSMSIDVFHKFVFLFYIILHIVIVIAKSCDSKYGWLDISISLSHFLPQCLRMFHISMPVFVCRCGSEYECICLSVTVRFSFYCDQKHRAADADVLLLLLLLLSLFYFIFHVLLFSAHGSLLKFVFVGLNCRVSEF